MYKTPTLTLNPAPRGKKPLLFRGFLGVLVILGVFFIFNYKIVKAGTFNLIAPDFLTGARVDWGTLDNWFYDGVNNRIGVIRGDYNPESISWGLTSPPAEKKDSAGSFTFTMYHYIPQSWGTGCMGFSGGTYACVLYGANWVTYGTPKSQGYGVVTLPNWDWIRITMSYNYHFIDQYNATGTVELYVYLRNTGENEYLYYHELITDVPFYTPNSDNRVYAVGLSWNDNQTWSTCYFYNPTTVTADFITGAPEIEITQPQNNDIILDNTYNFWSLKLSNLKAIQNLPQLATVKVNYWKTTDPNNVFTDETLLYIPTNPADILTYLDKSHDLPVGEYKAQAQLILNDNQTFNSSIITFNIVGETPSPSPPYPTPTISASPYPSAQPTLSPPPYVGTQEFCNEPQGSFLDYPVQNITYAICKIFTFLFIPDQEHLNSVTDFLNSWTNTLQKKPPFGWFYSIKSAFESTTPDNITTDYDFTVPVLGDTLKHALIFLFWFLAVIYIIIRVKTII